MKLWKAGAVLGEVNNISPLLASWEQAQNPAQTRLRAYLNSLGAAVDGFSLPNERLFLDLTVDVGEPDRLLRHYDLENYLTPVVYHLGARRFVLVKATKRVGNGSHLMVGQAMSGGDPPTGEGWMSFVCRAGPGAQSKRWKEGLRSSLMQSRPGVVPPGPVEVQLAWRCSPQRNWVWLWKPTGDAMGPVLGEPDPRNPFNPSDDRIVALTMHVDSDASIGHSVDVAMWWRPGQRRSS